MGVIALAFNLYVCFAVIEAVPRHRATDSFRPRAVDRITLSTFCFRLVRVIHGSESERPLRSEPVIRLAAARMSAALPGLGKRPTSPRIRS